MPYLQIDESRVFYEFIKREGIPLVFIHGWAGDHSKWEKQIEFFSNHYPVIVYDLAGHGKSGPAKDYSIKHHSIMLHNFLQQLKVTHIYLVGHSMGGMVAQQFAVDFSDYIQKLVLISTTSKIITSLRKRLAVLFMRFLLRISFNNFFRKLLSYTQTPEKSPEELTAMINYASSIPPHIIRKTFAKMTSFNSSKNISPVENPTLIIVGDKDPIISELMVRDLQKKVPNSSLKIISNGYHELMVDNPDEINRSILEFIESR